eukprot:m51a1_g2431 putative proteasome component region pci domain-containing protein (512) ;mRNA; f:840161-842623
MGDALATLFEAESCQQSASSTIASPSDMGSMTAYALARLCYDTLRRYGALAVVANEVHTVVPALEANTLLSGLGFESCGVAMAHSIQEGLTALPQTREFLHGEVVTVGVLASLFLHDWAQSQIADIYKFCELAAIADHKQKTDKYHVLLQQLFAKQAGADLQSFVTHLADDKTPLAVSRQVLQEVLEALPRAPAGLQRALCEHSLARLTPRASHFEEQIAALHEHMAGLCESEGRFREATDHLQAIPLDTTSRAVGKEEWCAHIRLRLARLALRAGDTALASSSVARASAGLPTTASAALVAEFKMTSAEVLDRCGEWLKASRRYYEVSTLATVSDRDKLAALTRAVHCALLAEAGPERSRLLGTLCKDERTAQLPSHEVLRKMYLERGLSEGEVQRLGAELGGDHQRAALGRAVVQHNLLAASRLYHNVGFDELGRLLGISPDEAERVAAKMIAEERLAGTIDQIGGFVFFESASRDPLLAWDAQIERACLLLGSILDKVAVKHPEIVAL